MDEVNLRRDMVATCRRMNELGVNQGASGNLSARESDDLLITPTSPPYDEMRPDDIVRMEFDGRYTGRRPSSEWRFQRDILAARPDVDAVLHCHSTFATTLARRDRGLPSFHYRVVVARGADIRCAPNAAFGAQALSLGESPILSDEEIGRMMAQMRGLRCGPTAAAEKAVSTRIFPVAPSGRDHRFRLNRSAAFRRRSALRRPATSSRVASRSVGRRGAVIRVNLGQENGAGLR